MKAAQISDYGHADIIKVVEVDEPKAGKDQVLVAVHASSINPFDTSVREGYLKDAIPLKLPVTLGGDIAGVVQAVGDGVVSVKVGDKVYGQANVVAGNSGAFAEAAVTAAKQLALMPGNVDYNEAAALALTGASALQAMTEHIKLQKGQKILIHGGAGGIGTIAIQIAKHLGAYVATTATGDGLDYVKGLGADEVIDYKSQAFDELLHDYDAVFDTVAGETYDRSFKVLRSGGIIVSMTQQPKSELMEQYGVSAFAQQTHVTTEILNDLTKLVEDKVVTPHVDKSYPLAEIQEAFKARESGTVKGKVVVSIQ